MLSAWLKTRLTLIRAVIMFASAMPMLYLMLAFYRNDLGPNPLETLTRTTGRSALILLAVTLCITPLRKWLTKISQVTGRHHGKRLADWNWLVRLRRMLGLWCFAYAVMHCWVYLDFDLAYDWAQGLRDIAEKPYLLAGALALLLLFPLAATSTQGMMRRLGKHWIRLHMLIYPIAILGLTHFWWLARPGSWRPWPETLALGLLLGYRLLLRLGWLAWWEGADGRETPERAPGPRSGMPAAGGTKEYRAGHGG